MKYHRTLMLHLV